MVIFVIISQIVKNEFKKFCHRILIKRPIQAKTEMKNHTAWQESLHKTETRSRISQKKST